MSEPEAPWSGNYFNYFTEIEEHFQKARGTSLFLLSPLDWALIESWKNAGVPLEAVLRAVDVTFDKWRARKQRGRAVNSLAYCAQEVVAEAERMQGLAAGPARPPVEAPFSIEELRAYLSEGAAKIAASGIEELAPTAAAVGSVLDQLEEHYGNLEKLETVLTGIEDKMIAVVRARQTEEEAVAGRVELEGQLRMYRGKMSAAHLAMLEKQYLDRRLLESKGLPRLSLFFLR